MTVSYTRFDTGATDRMSWPFSAQFGCWARHQFVDHLDQVFERAAEVIELSNDKDISTQ
jgi:hypothetical protein